MSTYSNFDKVYENMIPHRATEITEGLKYHCQSEKLHTTSALLSIGPGNGLVDEMFINDITPDVTNYYALDRDSGLLQLTKERIQKLKNIKGHYTCCCIEDYEGPSEMVDTILMSHSLYDLSITLEDCLTKVYKWLKPGGVLVIIIDSSSSSNGEESIFTVLNRAGLAVLKTSDVVKKALNKLHMVFSEYQIGLIFGADTKNSDLLMKMQEWFILRTPTLHENNLFRRIVEKYSSSCGGDAEPAVVHTNQTIFCVRKSSNNIDN